jgi:hypothetical protein
MVNKSSIELKQGLGISGEQIRMVDDLQQLHDVDDGLLGLFEVVFCSPSLGVQLRERISTLQSFAKID